MGANAFFVGESMNRIKCYYHYFTRAERLLWFFSLFFIVASFFLFHCTEYTTLFGSLIGVTAILFVAKGNPFGQILMILFCLFYGMVSWSFRYYGEVITYLGMSLPMAIFGLVSWLRHPFRGNRAEVEVSRLKRGEPVFLWIAAQLVTILFYFVLKYFHTANLIPCTVSVTTSFLAAYLSFRRNPFFALAYAANDVVLILLWILASLKDSSYVSVCICFAAFLFNDLYTFISWQKLEKKQSMV